MEHSNQNTKLIAEEQYTLCNTLRNKYLSSSTTVLGASSYKAESLLL